MTSMLVLLEEGYWVVSLQFLNGNSLKNNSNLIVATKRMIVVKWICFVHPLCSFFANQRIMKVLQMLFNKIKTLRYGFLSFLQHTVVKLPAVLVLNGTTRKVICCGDRLCSGNCCCCLSIVCKFWCLLHVGDCCFLLYDVFLRKKSTRGKPANLALKQLLSQCDLFRKNSLKKLWT